MPRIRRSIHAVVIAFCCAASAARSMDDADDIRLQAEAGHVLKILISRSDLTPCSVENAWDTYPVPESFARKYLGSTLHADLTGTFAATAPSMVLDPDHEHADAFCDKGRRSRYEAERREAFEKGNQTRADHLSSKVSFPVFSEDFTQAALILTSESEGLLRDKDKVVWPTYFLSIQAVAFHKIGGLWAEVGSEQLAVAE